MPKAITRFVLALLLSAIAFAARAEPAIGDTVPAFDTMLLDGHPLAGKMLAGKPVLVVFWATWCPICRRELPKLQKLYDANKGAGFEIVALSIDVEQVEVELFQQEHRHTFPVAMRTPRHSEIFGQVRLPPRFFLIDRSGRLAWKHVGAIRDDRLERELKRLL
jgi:thiol-disulfide isomerase/thioredoxin